MAQDLADMWGSIANVRWSPSRLPLTIGSSAAFYSAGTQATGSSAASAYMLLSLHRLTRNRVPITISSEYSQARNWNDSFTGSFVSNTNYSSTLSNSTSHGLYALVDWEITQRFSMQYKFDQLILDSDFTSDSYQRHGVGMKYYFASNCWTLLRYEKALTTVPSESNGTKTGALDSAWALVSISL